MSWTMYRWIWQLRSPLHLGWLPAGVLNRTRLYIPARALWGALTAELAHRQTSDPPDYKTVGEKLQQDARFSYLFPAELVDGEWKVWLPQYRQGKGLVWHRGDGEAELEDRRLRMLLLSTRPGTAIAPESDTAEEGTLRGFELISPYWQDGDGQLKPVAIVGYLFCKDTPLFEQVKDIDEIFVGGDIRYGLGHLQRVFLEEAVDLFGSTVDLSDDSPKVRSTKRVLAHTLPRNDLILLGSMECIAGWDTAQGGLKKGDLTWAPGSCAACCSREYTIRKDGLWEAERSQSAASSKPMRCPSG